MNHNLSIGSDFMTFGTEAIGVHHSTYTRLLRAEHNAVLNNVRGENRGTGLRAMLGNAMISLGTAIAGKTAHMQERKATSRSSSPTSGFAPTR
jgi:hypothetical protein